LNRKITLLIKLKEIIAVNKKRM